MMIHASDAGRARRTAIIYCSICSLQPPAPISLADSLLWPAVRTHRNVFSNDYLRPIKSAKVNNRNSSTRPTPGCLFEQTFEALTCFFSDTIRAPQVHPSTIDTAHAPVWLRHALDLSVSCCTTHGLRARIRTGLWAPWRAREWAKACELAFQTRSLPPDERSRYTTRTACEEIDTLRGFMRCCGASSIVPQHCLFSATSTLR